MNTVEKLLSRSIMQVGDASLTVGALLSAGLILVCAFVAVWLLRKFVRRAQRSVGAERAHMIYISGQVARYLVIAIGIAVAIGALGVDLSALSLFAGALGVGIGLGLRDIVRQFVAGIVLLFDRSIEVGDFVELADGTTGEVLAIGPRATTVVTNDLVHMLVPNASLIDGKLTNWTRHHQSRRVHIPFRTALDADKEKVRDAVLAAARALDITLPDTAERRAQVWLVKFGESALEFELVVWPTLQAVKRPGTMIATYVWAIDDALRANDIEIPLPQRELRLRDSADAARWSAPPPGKA